jgi:hypothetical protein
MGENCNDISSILIREGADKTSRVKTSLNPDLLKLQEFGIEQWMQFAYNFAKDVNYFNTNNNIIPDGDWQAFFKDETELKELLERLDSSNKLTAHLTLFICFLKLLDFSNERFNKLTKRHLDFYYEEILQITKLPEVNDQAHILFELAKNIDTTILQKGTELDGGKDEIGKKRIYELTEEFYPNKAEVVELKTVYNDPKGQDSGSYPIKCAPVANSLNGDGEEFIGEDHSWYPFGYNHIENGNPELTDATLGFAVASSILDLSEGNRHIVTQVNFQSATDNFTANQLRSNIEVYYTGEKGWVGPLILSLSNVEMNLNTGVVESFQTGLTAQKLTLVTTLDYEKEPLFPYNKEVHQANYTTSQPIFRYIVKTGTVEGYSIYKNFTKHISKVDIKVLVEGIRDLVLESDTGTLNPKKPFYPFTTNPVKGSRFSVFSNEIFSKNWKNIDVNIRWKNTPDSFNDHYRAYDKSFEESVAKDWFVAIKGALDHPVEYAPVGKLVYPPLIQRGFYSKYNSIVTNNSYFKANKYIFSNKQWSFINSGVVLFSTVPPSGDNQIAFETKFSVSDNGYTDGESGPVAITLNQSFLHELYPRIYALAMLDTDKDVLIPNQPYTPFADYISVNYTAEATLQVNAVDEIGFQDRAIQLFHKHPFGESEEHATLKSKVDFVSQNTSLAPTYCKGGELFIGVSNAQTLQQLSLLIQVKEGSENVLASSFEGDQKITWDILCSNHWKPLHDSTFMLLNQTDNFLKSGIVRFVIPREATDNNTLLPEGMFWVRAKMYKTFDAVCKVLSIDAQATLAEFDNRGNELSHLEQGIPADTIKKLVDRSALVKKVKQPYNSFGGAAAETDLEYYRRVSERLRHKNRAITLWDYEHLILQQFPEIFQVKCLNHTCKDSFTSAGHVTVVVIPDTAKKNVFDNYQPRVSKALLNQIGAYINQLNTLHVNAKIINPEYEEVQVSLKVKFYDGFDIPIYIQQLNKDITKYLSPWAFEDRESLRFGVTIYRSQLIDFIEKLDYVDYLQDVLLIKEGNSSLKSCTPSTPKSILVSAKMHDISTNIVTCTGANTNIIPEVCQL